MDRDNGMDMLAVTDFMQADLIAALVPTSAGSYKRCKLLTRKKTPVEGISTAPSKKDIRKAEK